MELQKVEPDVIYLTLCFYEWPAAIYDLDHWEERFKDYIEIVTRFEKNTDYEHIVRFDMETFGRYDNSELCIRWSKEKILCVPNNMVRGVGGVFDHYQAIVDLFEIDDDHAEVSKLLMIGSFTPDQLSTIGILYGILEQEYKGTRKQCQELPALRPRMSRSQSTRRVERLW